MKRLMVALFLFAASVAIADAPTGVLVSSTLALRDFLAARAGHE